MKLIYMWGICLLYCHANINAQVIADPLKNKKGYLKIGDTLPDMLLAKDIQKSIGVARLSELKGKLVILDFWGIKCSSCITAMPKMKKLQQQFGNQIQIILVTRNTTAQVEKLKNRLPLLQTIKLPMINNDTILSGLFEFATVPTHVWINEKGKVQFITDGWETTYEKIEKYLKGQKIPMAIKEDKKDFNPYVPLWLEGNGRQAKHLKYYSFIMGRLTDSRTSMSTTLVDSCNTIYGVKTSNLSVINLFQLAFDEGGKYNEEFNVPGRVQLEFDGAETYRQPVEPDAQHEWANKNLYCYELFLPGPGQYNIYDVMKDDLKRFFGLKGSIEKRKVKCLVLERFGNGNKLRASGKETYNVELNPFETNLVVVNAPIENLRRQLQYVYWKRLPILDETRYKDNVTLELDVDLTNLPLLQQALLQYGLRLTEQIREIDMLIIRKA